MKADYHRVRIPARRKPIKIELASAVFDPLEKRLELLTLEWSFLVSLGEFDDDTVLLDIADAGLTRTAHRNESLTIYSENRREWEYTAASDLVFEIRG
ncbi:hypothetical protein [Halostagnicola kamekurae]|uniref:hypothetical protein n=1 Tax=Halostagnicola kamekurae TaxID=619731 RepID=UPI001587B0ED